MDDQRLKSDSLLNQPTVKTNELRTTIVKKAAYV